MNSRKTSIVPFYYTKSHEEISSEANEKYKISLKYNEKIINRVHARYPLLSKVETALVVNKIVETFREVMIEGNIINFRKVLVDTKLYFFSKIINGKISTAIKLKITTPGHFN